MEAPLWRRLETWLTFHIDGLRVQRQVSGPVSPQLIVEWGDPPADVLVGGSLQEESHPLPRKPAEAANPRWWGGLQPVPYQELQNPISFQVQLGSMEFLRGLDTRRDEARAAAAGAHGHRGQPWWEADTQGPFGIEPVQPALRAVQGDLLHTALLLGQPTARTGLKTLIRCTLMKSDLKLYK